MASGNKMNKKNDESITVVIVIKNRDRIRAEQCINSLLEQTYPCKVIVVDYGSNDMSWYSEVFSKVGFIAVRHNIEVFNKSRALNIGFKHATTKYVLSTDIDCIFAPNFIEEVMKVFEKKPNSIVLCQKIDLTKEGVESNLQVSGVSGACIAILSEWIEKVHGYDEFYTYWGKEDDDLVNRAARDGYEIVWITNKTKLWHQWHEPSIRHTLEDNTRYYQIPSKPIIRNPNGWGEL